MGFSFLIFLYRNPDMRSKINLAMSAWWTACMGIISYIVIYYFIEFLVRGRHDGLDCPELAVFNSFFNDEWAVLLLTWMFLLPLSYLFYELHVNRDYHDQETKKRSWKSELFDIAII